MSRNSKSWIVSRKPTQYVYYYVSIFFGAHWKTKRTKELSKTFLSSFIKKKFWMHSKISNKFWNSQIQMKTYTVSLTDGDVIVSEMRWKIGRCILRPSPGDTNSYVHGSRNDFWKTLWGKARKWLSNKKDISSLTDWKSVSKLTFSCPVCPPKNEWCSHPKTLNDTFEQ